MTWHRKLIAQKYDGSAHRAPGRFCWNISLAVGQGFAIRLLPSTPRSKASLPVLPAPCLRCFAFVSCVAGRPCLTGIVAFEEKIDTGFSQRGGVHDDEMEQEKAELYQQIGRLQMDLGWLQKSPESYDAERKTAMYRTESPSTEHRAGNAS